MSAPPKRNNAVGTRTMALKAVPFFTQLNDRELDVVRAVASEKNYPKNAVVLTEGEMGDSLYMIQTGKVKVFIGDEDGREIILKILNGGDFFGEMSMIDKQPRSASVTTIESASFLVLTHAAFEKCVEQAPRIGNMVMRMLAQRVREADRKIGTLALMDVYGHRILKDLSDRGFISIESKAITIINRELPPSL
jgi:CRP/FNR family transcriptional regulator, cyclic AMP receptor protein